MGTTPQRQSQPYAPQRQPQPYAPQHQQRQSGGYYQQGNYTPRYTQPEKKGSKLSRKERRKKRLLRSVLVLLIVILLILAWPLYLVHTINSEIEHIDALSDKPETGGETWLIAGSDKRTQEQVAKGEATGQRSDTIMLIHKAPNGQASIASIPRDSAVEIPGQGLNKINASYSLGGPNLLVRTVENTTGMKVDHYIEVTMPGVAAMVDGIGGVNLCYDRDVDDAPSGMKWTKGCHDVNGQQALAFSRMRGQDPLGDIGRAQRQRQVIEAVVAKATDPWTLIWPSNQLAIGHAGANALVTDPDTESWQLLRMVLTYKAASEEGLTGAPPISSMGWTDGVHGSMVQLDPHKAPKFWSDMSQGTLTKDSYAKAP